MREVDAAMPVPLLTYTQAQSGQYDYAATPAAAVAAPASRRGSALARTGLPCGARSRPTSRLSVELDTIESDKDKDAEADGSSKALPLADAHGKNSVSASDKIQILDVDASESNHSILDTIRAQRRRTRKLAITIAAVVFCLLLLTGAIYGAVVDATWKKYQSKVSLSAPYALCMVSWQGVSARRQHAPTCLHTALGISDGRTSEKARRGLLRMKGYLKEGTRTFTPFHGSASLPFLFSIYFPNFLPPTSMDSISYSRSHPLTSPAHPSNAISPIS